MQLIAAPLISVLAASMLLFPGNCIARPAPAFDTVAISDQQLSIIRGSARSGFFAQVGRSFTESDAIANFRTTADVNRLTFDNWFTDVGGPLIFSNIVLQSNSR